MVSEEPHAKAKEDGGAVRAELGSLPLFRPQTSVCPCTKTLSGQGFGNSELGFFKVTLGQLKPPNWHPCTPSLCESTTGWPPN